MLKLHHSNIIDKSDQIDTCFSCTFLDRNITQSTGMLLCPIQGKENRVLVHELSWCPNFSRWPVHDVKKAWEILHEAQEKHSSMSMADERAGCGRWPKPVTPSEYLAWLKDEVRVQREQQQNNPDETDRALYAEALENLIESLERAGTVAAVLPWVSPCPRVVFFTFSEKSRFMVEIRAVKEPENILETVWGMSPEHAHHLALQYCKLHRWLFVSYERETGYVSGEVLVDVNDIVDYDLEGFLDILSERLIGSDLLSDINYQVAGHIPPQTLKVTVTGDISIALATLK